MKIAYNYTHLIFDNIISHVSFLFMNVNMYM